MENQRFPTISNNLRIARLLLLPVLACFAIYANLHIPDANYMYLAAGTPGDSPANVLPGYINEQAFAYSPSEWQKTPFIEKSEVFAEYKSVCESFDALRARHGYEREGYNYKVTRSHHETIAIFCHFGVMAVVMSHLLNCSPYSLWQHTCALPTSVTTIYTEERREGVALMRATGFGDLSHLYAVGEAPSFAARFCECYGDPERRD